MNAVSDRPLNVRLPSALADQIEGLSRATGRSKSFIAVEALRDYVSLQQWQIAEIEVGLAEADRGEFATEDEVNAVFAKYAG